MNPNGGVPVCPACGADTQVARVRYCDAEHVRGITDRGNLDWIDTTSNFGKHLAHLHVSCRVCHFEWMEQTLRDVEPVRNAQ